MTKNKLAIPKNLHCLNCGYPFSGQEVFCPECGQKNKSSKITFNSFINEVFAGFTSWDAKFWKTVFPLLTKPGKVSRDYIEGKRMRYVNPFRFYITTSIIFFLLIGLTNSYTKFKEIKSGKSANTITNSNFYISEGGLKKDNNVINLDTIQNKIYDGIRRSIKKKDSLQTIFDKNPDFTQAQKDSIFKANNVGEVISIPFGDSDKVGKFMLFQHEHPYISIDDALDSLKIEKNFANRFWYSKANFFNSLFSDSNTYREFGQQMISFSSIALFILLPIFTVFLFFLYLRRKFTYVENLIFVFHVQTVFFLLFSIFFAISLFKNSELVMIVFLLLFLIYLFIAMKKFYQQGYFKTFIKFFIANAIYFTLAGLGAFGIMMITFAVF